MSPNGLVVVQRAHPVACLLHIYRSVPPPADLRGLKLDLWVLYLVATGIALQQQLCTYLILQGTKRTLISTWHRDEVTGLTALRKRLCQ